jgi:hypothetical protein
MVEDEMRACGNARSDEVDCARVPHAVDGVNGYADVSEEMVK